MAELSVGKLEEAIALLSKSKEATVLKTVIHQKQAIADTFGQAATIWGKYSVADTRGKIG
ncbi:hypothetical protein LC653_31025 [Nostoc sp. CHAB 5784]|uniref:hypothetical protein n=1 Tax=Nostoc mirabile TaxID=2907820 RepID=UPI001E38A918|nr:hypothetical protein [Nostoc mirabile]MCC5668176.1 hypothetical protein [Nostoc mirabile CHAB5784]